MKSVFSFIVYLIALLTIGNLRASSISGGAYGTIYEDSQFKNCRLDFAEGRNSCEVGTGNGPKLSMVLDIVDTGSFFSVKGQVNMRGYESFATYRLRIDLPDSWDRVIMNVDHSWCGSCTPTWIYVSDGGQWMFPNNPGLKFPQPYYESIYSYRFDLTPGQEHFISMATNLPGGFSSETFSYTFSTTPEPSTTALLSVGAALGSFVYQTRRRRAKNNQ